MLLESYVSAIKSADLDRDGDIDLVCASDNKVYWLKNNGAQSFYPS